MSLSFSNMPPRTGWSEIGRGVSIPNEALAAPPTVQWKHIDGPLLHWACFMHWLTLRERLMLWLKLTDIERVAQKHWPQRADWVEVMPYDAHLPASGLSLDDHRLVMKALDASSPQVNEIEP